MKKIVSKKVILIEDHHQAYYAWKTRGFKNLPLIHIDAHMDFAFQEIKDARLILEEAKSLSELKNQLEKAILFKQKRLDTEKLTNIGNYIYPAMRDGIIEEFYWVIPGGRLEFKNCLGKIKERLKELGDQDPYRCDDVLFDSGFIKTKLYNKPLYICILETLQKIKKPALLDIDTDFLIMDSLKKANPATDIGKRRPWINPERLVAILKEKVFRPQFITIAYSVNGGFTPLAYKTLGDRIAKYLGYSDSKLERRLLAGEYFQRFRESLDKNNFASAAYCYQQALRLNPKYRILNNNYGPLYLGIGNYTKAKSEFKAMLKADKKDNHAISGLGRIYLAKKALKKARFYFRKALSLNPKNEYALLNLAETELRLKNYHPAERLISRYKKLEPMRGISGYLLGQIYEKQHTPQKAFMQYKEALRFGFNNPDLWIKLAKLSQRLDKNYFACMKNRFKDYKKDFCNLLKRKSRKKTHPAQIKPLQRKIAKLERLLSS